MKSVIVFAGTIEGSRLSEYLCGRQVPAVVCVATEYGETLLKESAYLKVHTGRMDREQIKKFILEKGAALVVDATHPYAAVVSRNVSLACEDAGTEYIRLIRKSGNRNWESGQVVEVSTVEEAAAYLKETEGNILVTTGSKELARYTVIPDYETRVFARVLSTGEVALACEKLGFRGKNLICMQGPFSEELNTAMLRQFDCRYLVTKETGKAGGFEEKIRAARKAGAKVVLVGRPPEQEGYSYEEVIQILEKRLGERKGEDIFSLETRCGAETGKELSASEQRETDREKDSCGGWIVKERTVTLVGVGMGTARGMTVEATEAVREADLLIGAERMFRAAGIQNKSFYQEYDAQRIADYIKAHPEYTSIAVLLSGDIGFYSGAKKLYEALNGLGCEIRSLCGISSVVYFCGKLRIPWEDVCLKSAHGRKANLIGAVKTHEKTFTILSGADSVGKLCRELQEYGLSGVKVHVGERLGYEEEKITSGSPGELEDGTYDGLCVALIEHPAYFGGIETCVDDEAFLRGKAPMTKSEIRSLSVAKLRLTRDAVVYDVGAGTGSVSVEMALMAVDGEVYAIERKEEACSLIEKNKQHFGTPNIQVIPGLAPGAMEGLPAPTHAFIGGSAGNLREIMECLLRKNPKIRMVINTVTLETIGEVTECLKTLPVLEEEILSVSIAKAKGLGQYHLMMGQNPIYIVTCRGGSL